MIPGFERKVRKLVGGMRRLDPALTLEVGPWARDGKGQAMPFTATYTVGGQTRAYHYMLKDQERGCGLYIRAEGRKAYSEIGIIESGLGSEELPRELIEDLAVICLLDQLVEALPGPLAEVGARLKGIDRTSGEFAIEKDGSIYDYELNVDLTDNRYHARLDSSDNELWEVPIGKHLKCDKLAAKVLSDPYLTRGWHEQRKNGLQALASLLCENGLDAVQQDAHDLCVNLGAGEPVAIEMNPDNPECFELTYDMTNLQSDSSTFRNWAKLAGLVQGLSPEKLVAERRAMKQKGLKPSETVQPGMESSVDLV